MYDFEQAFRVLTISVETFAEASAVRIREEHVPDLDGNACKNGQDDVRHIDAQRRQDRVVSVQSGHRRLSSLLAPIPMFRGLR